MLRVRIGGRKVRTNLRPEELRGATLEELLLHGLSHGDASGMELLLAARGELATLGRLAEGSRSASMRRLGDTLALIGRRLDVALELLRRGR